MGEIRWYSKTRPIFGLLRFELWMACQIGCNFLLYFFLSRLSRTLKYWVTKQFDLSCIHDWRGSMMYFRICISFRSVFFVKSSRFNTKFLLRKFLKCNNIIAVLLKVLTIDNIYFSRTTKINSYSFCLVHSPFIIFGTMFQRNPVKRWI